jgi:phosphohistidine phosphatase
MNLYLLRHADAEDFAASRKDPDRSLSAHGREVMEVMAAAFERVGEPKTIWHSPYARAKETALFIALKMPKAKIRETPMLVPEADPREIFVALAGGKGGDVLLVGHQPHLGRTLGLAVTGNADVEIPMHKGSIARVSFPGSHPSPPGSLKWLLSPSLAQHVR